MNSNVSLVTETSSSTLIFPFFHANYHSIFRAQRCKTDQSAMSALFFTLHHLLDFSIVHICHLPEETLVLNVSVTPSRKDPPSSCLNSIILMNETDDPKDTIENQPLR